MARTAQIHYERITLSFPKELVKELKKKVDKGSMSSYVAKIIEKDLEKKERSAQDVIDSIRHFGQTIKTKDKRSSLEILRSIRSGKE